MMLKNLMEDKQLDFNQPLLSVRRFSSPAAPPEADNRRKTDKPLPKLPPLPVYKSELKSGPVRNPGTIPFVWERTPGKPKDERKSQPQAPEQPSIAPKLPPGRVLNVRQEALDRGSRSTIATQSQTKSILSSSRDVSNLDKRSFTEDKISKQGTDKKSSSGSEDGDETYLDALDTLSRSESFFMNCSISGVSGLDGLDVKPSGTFSTDPQTRDFMMGRFLPAAKAMASEAPQHAPRKPQVVREQPRQVNKVVNENKQHALIQYRSNSLPPYAQELGREESDDESVTYEGSDILSAKVCGLFPRFCLKNSFCLLNPVPGMKMQTYFPVLSARRVPVNSSSASSCSETKMEHGENFVPEQRSMVREQTAELNEGKIELKYKSNEIEGKSVQNLRVTPLYKYQQGNGLSAYHSGYATSKLPERKGFLGVPEKEKNSRERGFDIHKSKRSNFRELLNNENTGSGSLVVEKTLYIDSVHTVKSLSSNSSSSEMKSFTDCKGNDVEISEKSSAMEDASSVDSSLQYIKGLSVVDEKATMPKNLKSVDSCYNKSTLEKQMDKTNGSRDDEYFIPDFLALTCSKVADQESFDLESQWSGKSWDQEKVHDLTNDSITFASSKKGENKIDMESQQGSGLDDQEGCYGQLKMTDDRKTDLKKPQLMKLGTEKSSLAPVRNSTTKIASNKMIDLESERLGKLGNLESFQDTNLQMPLALLLPKSPSESWLRRTLPTISARNSSSRSSLAARIGASIPMASLLDPKWENIVKTSNVQHGRLRFSEEHPSPIPEA